MKRYVIKSYEAAQAAQVSELMAIFRRARRLACPLLPPGLEDSETAAKLLADMVDGLVALDQDGAVAGFLFAETQADSVWGTATVTELDRYALRPGTGSDVLASLYAAACENRREGLAEHYTYCSAFDLPMLDAWFQLGFGLEQAYGVTGLAAMESTFLPTENITIRRAHAGDEDLLESLSPTVALMQAKAPVWAGAPEEYLKGLREGFRELATESEGMILLAFRGSAAVGYQAWFPVGEHPVDGVNKGAIELAVAGTIPEERGGGVGRMLTSYGVAEALKAGYTSCFTDWRTANPLSSRFWRARGFKPYRYRLVRRPSFPA